MTDDDPSRTTGRQADRSHPMAAMASLVAIRPGDLRDLVRDGGDARVARLATTIAGIRFDWTKTHLDDAVMAAGLSLAEAQGYSQRVRALFAGEMVNPSEQRAATHTAERGEGAVDDVALSATLHRRMRQLVEAVEAGAFGDVRHVIHLGIGGSALGPALLIDALSPVARPRRDGGGEAGDDGRGRPAIACTVVSNVDGVALSRAMAASDPHGTLVVVASKTFTTSETMRNAASALAWMEAAGVADPLGRFIALTAAPERAAQWGIDDTRILPFAETVGGRYSLWSSIGFPAALTLGWNSFAELLEGAAEMDRHVRLSPWADNVVLRAAIADLFYVQNRGAQTRAVFAYDERLRLLPAYLQQLEMESNGKAVGADGSPLGFPTAPVTWGGTGTDAQHAVFQLLHQGSWLVPVEFVASIRPGHALDADHHDQLLGNCVAQGAALMEGRAHDDPQRAYAGNRPSATILLPDVTPRALGALVSFYEHRVFANAVMLGINPFDQFGVELGKAMARDLADAEDGFDPATRALWEAIHAE